jgi:CubicO group peptidase (beta-lactamase class C family)
MAAKGVCSAAFVAGRPVTNLLAEEVLPASPILKAVSVSVDEVQHTVTARFAGLFARRAALVRDRGCVLDVEPDPTAKPYKPVVDNSKPWPFGDAVVPVDQWGPGVDAAKLQQVVEGAFVGAGNPQAANARGLAVVHHGRLLVSRDAPGFAPGTALHGWSMTKSVVAMLTHKLAGESGLPLDAPVVSAFPVGREPAWVAGWRKDGRKDIKVMDLLYMRDGLASEEDYNPWGSVPIMLWREPDAAAWAAHYPLEAAPGSRWRYLSATANLLSAVDRGQFVKDTAYWQYPSKALFEPLGMKSATLETDVAGNWIGSSYLWASINDWARMAQMMLQDGVWEGKAVLPPGWLKRATTPSVADGEGAAYTAMSYLYGDPKNGECKKYPGVPQDTLVWSGHWGQVVAMVPSKDAVVVRLGWVWQNYDECQLLSDVLSTLSK